MLAPLGILGIMLLVGMLQGMTQCNLTCGPLLFLRLAGRGKGAKQGLVMSLLFALPRIVLLTLLGTVFGALGFTMGSLAGLSGYPWFQVVVYILIGLVMISTGLFFIGVLRKKECTGKPGMKERVVMFLIKMGPRKDDRSEGMVMFGIGILVSLVCFVEASAASVFFASMIGIDAEDIGSGALWGALSMLSYSIGLAVPLLLFGMGASFIGKKLKREDVRAAGGMLLLLFGGILVLFSIFSLIFSLA
ncbi:MAG: sulfite exporter TauE/SafE family protein [Thermoplasmatota archaeon]